MLDINTVVFSYSSSHLKSDFCKMFNWQCQQTEVVRMLWKISKNFFSFELYRKRNIFYISVVISELIQSEDIQIQSGQILTISPFFRSNLPFILIIILQRQICLYSHFDTIDRQIESLSQALSLVIDTLVSFTIPRRLCLFDLLYCASKRIFALF